MSSRNWMILGMETCSAMRLMKYWILIMWKVANLLWSFFSFFSPPSNKANLT